MIPSRLERFGASTTHRCIRDRPGQEHREKTRPLASLRFLYLTGASTQADACTEDRGEFSL